MCSTHMLQKSEHAKVLLFPLAVIFGIVFSQHAPAICSFGKFVRQSQKALKLVTAIYIEKFQKVAQKKRYQNSRKIANLMECL